MTDTLVIHLQGGATDPVGWHPLGRHASPHAPSGRGTLTEASEAVRGWRTLAIVPADEILLTQVSIPTSNRQKLLQAIPYALENELIEEIERLHFAVEKQGGAAATAVAVCSRERLDGWLQLFHSHGIQPLGLFPDLLCLPLTSGHWSLYLGRHRALVRSGLNQGFSAKGEDLEPLLKLALGEAGEPPRQLDLFLEAENEGALEGDLWRERLELVRHPIEGGLTRLLAENLDEKQAINLLQGDYQQVDRKTLQWRRWLPAASLFVLFVGLGLFSSLLDYSRYQRESTRLGQEIRQVFRQTFPQSKRIVDPRVQMEQRLKALKKGHKTGDREFISLLRLPAVIIAKTPRTRLQNISYRDGKLDLKLTIGELQALEEIKQRMEAQGLRVEIRSANASGNQVSSHLRITRGSA